MEIMASGLKWFWEEEHHLRYISKADGEWPDFDEQTNAQLSTLDRNVIQTTSRTFSPIKSYRFRRE